MLVRYQAPIAELRGRQGDSPGGDIVHSVAKGGRPILRTGFYPANPSTTPQQEARNLLTTLAGKYKALTAAKAKGWRDAAALSHRTDALGRAYKLDGMGLHNMCNTHRELAGAAYSDTAPTIVAPLPPLTLDAVTVVAIDNEIRVSGTCANAANATYSRVRITRALGSEVRQAQQGDLRFPGERPQYLLETVENIFFNTQEMTRFAVSVGDYIGVEIQFIHATSFLPSQSLFVRSVITTAPV